MKYQQHIIIDGYNFIFRHYPEYVHKEKDLWQAREDLIHKTIAFRGNKNIQISIVFDGQDLKGIAKIHRPRGIHVTFSKAPQKADPMIIALVEKSKNKRDITVVTSDNALGKQVQSMGCMLWSIEILRQKIDNPQNEKEYRNKYDVNMGPKELDEWMDIFKD